MCATHQLILSQGDLHADSVTNQDSQTQYDPKEGMA